MPASTLPSDQLRLQCLEERLDGGVVIAITFGTRRWAQAMGLQLLLVGIGTVLAAPILCYLAGMEDFAFGGLPQA